MARQQDGSPILPGNAHDLGLQIGHEPQLVAHRGNPQVLGRSARMRRGRALQQNISLILNGVDPVSRGATLPVVADQTVHAGVGAGQDRGVTHRGQRRSMGVFGIREPGAFPQESTEATGHLACIADHLGFVESVDDDDYDQSGMDRRSLGRWLFARCGRCMRQEERQGCEQR